MKIPAWVQCPQKAFAAVGLLFGMVLVFLTPPFQAPDELPHFYRAYEVSELRFMAQKNGNDIGDFLPVSLKTTAESLDDVTAQPDKKVDVSKVFKALKTPLCPNEKAFLNFHNTALYSPLAYFPQAAGIGLGRFFSGAPFILMYCGRITNLIIWIFLIYFAIRITPLAKWVFFLLALIPMSIFLSASLSPDALINGLSFLLIAYFFYCGINKDKTSISRKDLLVILVLSCLLALLKQVYLVILLSFFLVPIKKMRDRFKYFLFFAGFFLISFSVGSFWLSAVKEYISLIAFPPGICPSEQLSYILGHLAACFIMMIKTSISHLFYLRSFVGILGWFDTHLPIFVTVSYPVVLFIVSLFYNDDGMIPNRRQRLLATLIVFTVFMGVMLFSYMINTQVGRNEVLGVSGRYFIPVSPLLFIIFYGLLKPLKKKLKISFSGVFLVLFSIIMLIMTLYSVFVRYYAQQISG